MKRQKYFVYLPSYHVHPKLLFNDMRSYLYPHDLCTSVSVATDRSVHQMWTASMQVVYGSVPLLTIIGLDSMNASMPF